MQQDSDKLLSLLTAHKDTKNELAQIDAMNEKTLKFGLMLSEEQCKELVEYRNESLKKYRRVEFGEGILKQIVYAFCDSAYIEQDSYLETLERLQDIFFEFKNESMDLVNDEELLRFMREKFDEVCFGDLDYLETTCLERFAAAKRSGEKYTEEETRWDKELFLAALNDQF